MRTPEDFVAASEAELDRTRGEVRSTPLSAAVQVLVEGERSVRDRLAALEAQRGERDCTGVVRTTFGPARAKGLVWHRPLQTEWRRLPSQSWRTICGWQFGSGQFEWLEAPQGGKACEKCFFEEVLV